MDKLCEYIDNEMSEIERKAASGRVSNSDIERADMLAHLKKSILTNEAMEESYSREYRPIHGNSYARRHSYAPRRDSMGRYSRDDAVDDMVDELEELMEKAPDEQTKKEFRKFISKVQTM